MGRVTVSQLRDCLSKGLEAIKKEKDVKEAVVSASWVDRLVARVNYTSDIPCNGIEEPKSKTMTMIGVSAVFTDEKEGRGTEPNDISVRAVMKAFRKAREGRVKDEEFESLPQPTGEKPALENYHDSRVMNISEKKFVELGGRAVEGALEVFSKAGHLHSLIIGGDVDVIKERLAVKSTTGIDDYDERTVLVAHITTMIEGEGESKGTGWSSATHLVDFQPEEAGQIAARSTIATLNGRRLKSGKYPVILGSQAVTTLFANLVVRTWTLGEFYAAATPFLGKMGQRIASVNLIVYDHGALPGLVGSRRICDSGLPTGRTDLIDKGRLVGLLSNDYLLKIFKRNDELARRLGENAKEFLQKFVPRNGPHNIIIEGEKEVSRDQLLSEIKEGIYIGRLWYLYPINMLTGDFTGTVVGDSYFIRDGKLAEPLKPNTVRLHDSFTEVLNRIVGISQEKKPTLLWATEEIVVAPEIAFESLILENIAQFMDSSTV